VAWATAVLDRLALRGDETVLDAGCGSGRVTKMLLERLPHGRVVAVDSAPSMVDRARKALEPRATVKLSDLVDLALDEPVDAAFSNAVFHWIPDHDRLFARLHAAMRSGARLSAQCGGRGNVERFHNVVHEVAAESPYAEYLGGWGGPWNYAGADETAHRLERAGFTAVETWLEPWPITPPEPREYMRSVCLGHHLERLPADLSLGFVEEVARRAAPELDYVRLNIVATRA
jgi:trans-aconitate 2-methyltransferase